MPANNAQDHEVPAPDDHDPTQRPPTTYGALPIAVESERFVLAAMLHSDIAIGDVVEILNPDDFAQGPHRSIYDAIIELYGSGKRADRLRVTAVLRERNELEQCDGADYLDRLWTLVRTEGTVADHARRVKDAAVRRMLIDVGTSMQHAANSGPDTAELIEQAQAALTGMALGPTVVDSEVHIAETFQDILDTLEATGPEKTADCPRTGFTELDRLLGGLHPGHLVVIGGRAGMGKTAFVLSILRYNVFTLGLNAALFTREGSAAELTTRLMSAEARIPHQAFTSADLTDAEWKKLAKTMATTGNTGMFIDDRTRTVKEVRAKARRMQARHGLDLIIVDFLQLFSVGQHDRYREAADISRALKDLARDLNIPVVAVSQFNRMAEQRTDKRPMLSDLRDSGTIEDDADAVLLLHRDDYYDLESPRAGECDVYVAKHRWGPKDVVTLAAQLHLSRMVDMAIGPAK